MGLLSFQNSEDRRRKRKFLAFFFLAFSPISLCFYVKDLIILNGSLVRAEYVSQSYQPDFFGRETMEFKSAEREFKVKMKPQFAMRGTVFLFRNHRYFPDEFIPADRINWVYFYILFTISLFCLGLFWIGEFIRL